jgi:hypothetical protein
MSKSLENEMTKIDRVWVARDASGLEHVFRSEREARGMAVRNPYITSEPASNFNLNGYTPDSTGEYFADESPRRLSIGQEWIYVPKRVASLDIQRVI